MSEAGPDTTGFTLQHARELLADAGVGTVRTLSIGPDARDCEGSREFVIRQRATGDGELSLTVACEWRSPVERERER